MNRVKPFISVLIVILTLFTIVFVKMEIRRVGYAVWKESKKEKILKEKVLRLNVKLAKKMDPSKLHKYAKNELDLKKANYGQIIQITGEKIVIKQ